MTDDEIKKSAGIPGLILGVDFDGTLCEHKYPEIGNPKKTVIEFVQRRVAKGDKIILWTCRNGKELGAAIEWCGQQGIIISAVNDDIPEIKDSDFGREKSCKIYCNYFIDDRNLSIANMLALD